MCKGLVIAGPTGVGKTDISINLAKKLDADIISADSAQVYKGMDIGTAKIMADEMSGIKHYMLDIVEPIEKYSVGSYQQAVDEILKDEEKKQKKVLIVGGTGLYINSITEGLAQLPSGNKAIRDSMAGITTAELYKELQKVDENAAKTIHPNNRVRIERALEIFKLTGEKFSILSKKNIKGNHYNFYKIALEMKRENLYDRINKRVDIMLESGLVQEVIDLYKKYGDILKKINVIGYNELIEYYDGNISLDRAIYLIKQNSRKYAKRQLTWFKNDKSYNWYNLDEINKQDLIEDILQKIKKYE